MGLETEVKFAVADLPAVQARLFAAGAELIAPRTLEVNLRLDNPWDGLTAAGKVLRLRYYHPRTTLTLKLPAGPWRTNAKVLHELEVELGDFETAQQMLKALGFRVWFRYEKYRVVYQLAGAEVCLDELPFGDFVEIEGELGQIEGVAGRLGLLDAERITTGYLELFRQARVQLNLPFDDCTFANWEAAGPDRG